MIFLEKVIYIHYLVQFQKRSKDVTMDPIDLDSQVNGIIAAYAKKLDLLIRQTNVGAKKLMFHLYRGPK